MTMTIMYKSKYYEDILPIEKENSPFIESVKRNK